MDDKTFAKIEASRARAAREAAAAQSQRDLLAGRRDEFGNLTMKGAKPVRPATPRRKSSGVRSTRGVPVAYAIGDKCKRCARPMGPKREEGRVAYGSSGYCGSCKDYRDIEMPKPTREDCEKCGKLMRPRGGKAADWPDRAARGTTQCCLHCKNPSITPRPREPLKPNCTGCDAPLYEKGETRPTPEHRRRSARGMCCVCYKHDVTGRTPRVPRN